jgi:hypothetical protein
LSAPRGLAGALIAGGLLGAALTLATGWAIDGLGLLTGDPGPGRAYRAWLSAGGWAWPSVWGAALGIWLAAPRLPSRRANLLARALAVLLALAPLAWHPLVPERVRAPLPATAEGRIRLIRRLSYRSPDEVAQLLPLSRDPDARVRARATLALGVNTIVTDIEHDRPGFPSRHSDHPLRDSLRVRLREALADPDELVRAEAARALLKAPRAFGPHPAAAETLAAMLERRHRRAGPGREAWLALDAAAGSPDPALREAARRFADATPDTALARIARGALDAESPPAVPPP